MTTMTTEERELDRPRRRRKSQASATGLIIGLCVGGAVIVVGLFVLAFLLIRTSITPVNPPPIAKPKAKDGKTEILGGAFDPVFIDAGAGGWRPRRVRDWPGSIHQQRYCEGRSSDLSGWGQGFFGPATRDGNEPGSSQW